MDGDRLHDLPETACARYVVPGAQLGLLVVDDLVQSAAFGVTEPLPLTRWGGNTFVAQGNRLGGIPIAFDDHLLYLGPFALARSG